MNSRRPFKIRGRKADPLVMRDDKDSPLGADPFGSTDQGTEAPPARLLGTSEGRLQLLAELRGLIEEDAYEVDADVVAEAIMEENGLYRLINWED